MRINFIPSIGLAIIGIKKRDHEMDLFFNNLKKFQ